MLRDESSKRAEIGAKSRVKPAKILMLRSFPSTSDRITVSPPAGSEVLVLSGGGGMAGPRLFCRGRCCFGFEAATAMLAVRRE